MTVTVENRHDFAGVVQLDHALVAQLLQRHFGDAVRLEVADTCSPATAEFLLQQFSLSDAAKEFLIAQGRAAPRAASVLDRRDECSVSLRSSAVHILGRQEDAAARKIPIVAPAGFMEEATSENILAGGAMGRRAQYQFGFGMRSSKGSPKGNPSSPRGPSGTPRRPRGSP